MRKQLILAVFWLLTYFAASGQKSDFGKVTLAELTQKNHPVEASAAAAILCRTGQVDFQYSESEGFEMVTTVQTKIKIYKKEGYDWANADVPYYNDGRSKENVRFSDAVTYTLVNGKIVKTKLRSEGEFEEKTNRYWSKKKITMPAVEEGCIIEFEYKITSPNFDNLAEWDFQAAIPVNYSEFKTNIPEYFTYNPNQKGYIFPKVARSTVSRSIIFQNKERTDYNNVTQTSFSNQKVDYLVLQTTYTAENLPALKDESFVNNIHNYTSGITHELAMVKFPNSLARMFSTDWKAVTETIYKSEDFGGELNKSGYFNDDLNTVVAGKSTPAEKAMAIFNHVKSTVRWNGYNGYSCNDGVRQAYKDKIGNVAEINLMLTAMLRHAGLDANPVLVSTRENGISLFPNRTAFNYVVSALEMNGEIILLDATEKFSAPDVLPLRDLNWNGRLIRKNGTSLDISMMPKKPSKETVNMMYTLATDGHVEGKIRKQLSDNMALNFRQKYFGSSGDVYLERLENENDHVVISDYVRDESDIGKPLLESYSFTKQGACENIGDKLYLSPLLFMEMEENPFKMETRDYPVDFGFSWNSKYNISLDIPEGYAIESLPTSISMATEGGLGSFKYVIGSAGNKVQVTVFTEINEPIVTPDNYGVLKDFYQKMVDKQKEKIVLKKI